MSTADDDLPAGFLSRWSRRKAQVRQGAVPVEPVPLPVPPPAPAAAASAAVPPARSAPSLPSLPLASLPPIPAEPVPAPAPSAPATAPAQAEPLPTLEDAAALPRGADVRRFVAPGVAPDVRNAALKRLFADPHFNVMDGLDTYIDDYGKPDPLPAGMLRQMVQSRMLGLFKDEDEAQADAGAGAHADGQAGAQAQTQQPPATAGQATEVGPAAEPAATLSPPTAPDEDFDLRLQPLDATGPGRPAPGAGPDTGRQH